MGKILHITAADIDSNGYFTGDTRYVYGNIEIAGGIGVVRFPHNVCATVDINVLAGTSIEADRNVIAGRNIIIGWSIAARRNIQSGGEIICGYRVKADWDIIASKRIKCGCIVEAGRDVKTNGKIKAGIEVIAGRWVRVGYMGCFGKVQAGKGVILGEHLEEIK